MDTKNKPQSKIQLKSLYIPASTYEKLKKIADKEKTKISAVILEILADSEKLKW